MFLLRRGSLYLYDVAEAYVSMAPVSLYLYDTAVSLYLYDANFQTCLYGEFRVSAKIETKWSDATINKWHDDLTNFSKIFSASAKASFYDEFRKLRRDFFKQIETVLQ